MDSSAQEILGELLAVFEGIDSGAGESALATGESVLGDGDQELRTADPGPGAEERGLGAQASAAAGGNLDLGAVDRGSGNGDSSLVAAEGVNEVRARSVGEAIGEFGGLAEMGSVLGGGVLPAVGLTVANGGGGTSAGSIAGAVLKNAFGMVPLARLLFSIFGGGGGKEAPAPLVKYTMPEAIDFEAADVGGEIAAADYDQMGAARVNSKPTQARMPMPPRTQAQGQTHGQAQQPQITVNVQAMDARSFLDHSSEIAQAVREAMLNLSSINDVVSEL